MIKKQHEQEHSEASTTRDAMCFRYRLSKVMAREFMLVILVGTAMLSVFAAKRSGMLDGAIVVAVGYGLFGPLYLLGHAQNSVICVDKNAIAAMAVWYRWRSIEWENVKKIRVYPAIRYPGGRSAPFFTIDQSLHRRSALRREGPIMFTDEIVGCRALRDLINVYVTRYQIPVQSHIMEGTEEFIKEPRHVERL